MGVPGGPDAADAGYREDAEGFTVQLFRTTDATVGRMVLSPEVAEALTVALAAQVGVPGKDDTRSPGRRRHDALGAILARSLNSGRLGELGSLRPQIVIHVDYPTLAVVLAHAKNHPELAKAARPGRLHRAAPGGVAGDRAAAAHERCCNDCCATPN